MTEQEKNSKTGLIVLISVLSAAAPIGTDLYLPAVPDMPAVFGTTEAVINLTLVSFYFCMAVGMLFWGPISDRFGRKRPLLATLGVFCLFGSIGACAMNVWVLVFCRICQGIGGGGMAAIATALVKDHFDGHDREKVLTITQAIMMSAPVVAPIAGAAILSFATWRATFWAQVFLGLCCLIPSFFIEEPLAEDQRTDEGVIRSLGRLVVVGRNKSFLFMLLILALIGIPSMCYISSVAYIYMDFFSLSKMQYSIYFAIAAGAVIVGSLLVIPVTRVVTTRQIVIVVFWWHVATGILLLFFGTYSAVVFLILYSTCTFVGSFARPVTTAVLLEQQERDTGSASSLINFTHTAFGSIGMVLATLPWPNHIFGLGVTMTVCATLALTLWTLLMRSSIVIKGLK